MKAYTDIEQSKKLAEILPLESADMKWFIPADDEGEFIEKVSLIENKSEYNLFDKITNWDDTPYVPCWSLAALLEVYPMCVGRDLGMYCCWVNTKSMCSSHFDNPVDACVDMILKLKERNLI